uniref:Uncharacterized protein n=1 Tax=Xenopus tropicalis TaxID=8364 RepID=A0A803K062_XENTR
LPLTDSGSTAETGEMNRKKGDKGFDSPRHFKSYSSTVSANARTHSASPKIHSLAFQCQNPLHVSVPR